MGDRLEHQQEIEYDLANIQPPGAKFEDPPEWTSSDGTIVDLRVAEDGLSAIAGSLDANGSVVITVTGDARWGPEVVPVIGTIAVLVAPPDVQSFDIVAGGAPRPRT
jgi:hypothetical protein